MVSAHPLRPLIAVIGATGTGKSQLAVDLARSLNGEIINADAMQMYEGLPIITNKMTIQERQGVPHHFLGTVPRDQEIRVGQWEVGVRKVIDEIRARGRSPILVGGTHYYIQALLYPRSLLPDAAPAGEGGDPVSGDEGQGPGRMTGVELAKQYPILNAPTSEILQKLQEVDPVMAARWHPNDHRKIRRSLEIYYLHNCTPASEVYRQQKLAEQQKRKCEASSSTAIRFRNLIFWVHAEPGVLNERLGGRVDKMVHEGLFSEIGELWEWYTRLVEVKGEVDVERGVLQSIGFKEFLPWLVARREAGLVGLGDGEGEKAFDGKGEVGQVLERLRKEGLERMKIATVQYARTQVKWIRIKLMNAMREANEEAEAEAEGYEESPEENPNTDGKEQDRIPSTIPESANPPSKNQQPSNILYLLDSSNISKFAETVSEPAISIARRFIAASPIDPPLPDPLSLSELAASCLKPKRDYDLSNRPDLWVKRTCEVCGVTTVDADSWRKHERSGRHKKMVGGRRKWEEAQKWKERRERGELEKRIGTGTGNESAECGGDVEDSVDVVEKDVRRVSLQDEA